MSSMRNAAPRRPHKERSQPAARSKWGLLEKHKDYSLRARDYANKRQKLAILEAKARDRNPDEFAFGMLSADKARQGQHGRGDRPEDKLSVEAAKLLKTQDAGYLRTVAQKGRREMEELERKVGLQKTMDDKAPRHKVVFVDGEEDGLLYRQSTEGLRPSLERPGLSIEDVPLGHEIDQNDENDNATSEIRPAQNTSNLKSRKQALAAQTALAEARAARTRRKRLREARVTKLEALKRRQKEIMAAAERLELQRAKMARSVGGTNKDGVKFRIRERRK